MADFEEVFREWIYKVDEKFDRLHQENKQIIEKISDLKLEQTNLKWRFYLIVILLGGGSGAGINYVWKILTTV